MATITTTIAAAEKQLLRNHRNALKACKAFGSRDPKRALAAGYRALECARQLGAAEEGSTLAHIAYLLARMGEEKQSDQMIERAITLVAPLGDRNALGKIYGSQAALLNNQGSPLLALKCYLKALRLIDEETIAHAAILDGLGFALQQLGRPVEAVQYLLRSIEIYESHKSSRPPSAASYGVVASIYMELGDYRRTRSYLKQAEAAAIATNDVANHANVMLGIGALELKLWHFIDAKRSLNKAERLARKHGFSRVIGESLSMQAELARVKGNVDQSLAYTLEALEYIAPTDHMLFYATYLGLGDTLAAAREWTKAGEAYQMALVRCVGNAEAQFLVTQKIAGCQSSTGDHVNAFKTLARGIHQLKAARTRELSRALSVEKEFAKLRRGSGRIQQLELESKNNSNALAQALKEIERQRHVILDLHRENPSSQKLGSARESRSNSTAQDLLRKRVPELSPTELRICEMLALSIPTKEIALLLSTSTRTIEWHRSAIRKKIKLSRKENLALALLKLAK